MGTKLRLSDMTPNCLMNREFTVHEGLAYLDSVPELTRRVLNENVVWVGEGCETSHWIAIYESVPKRFRVVQEVKFSVPSWTPEAKIETFKGVGVWTLDDLAAMVEDALFQLKTARAELAEYTRITRKAEVRNAAKEYEL